MSYQVLARKYRPSNFHETVGQEHVLRALINALDNNRLHHAYLFTGTRGVGKTTIARILAKCLNCEHGITSTPCGECNACRDIAEGRFIDLIEVDAASRTKVEDTRELLENIQYAPTSGRFKVYLIDEVHMLSNHSFNALLKTLEEPPPHVKFLLATTDPQKLPITVLSRCLQFALKNMTQDRIVSHLNHVLDQESIQHDEAALWSIAGAAEGSMRDALSLTDQAIAFGAGTVASSDVNTMLGAIDRGVVSSLLETLFTGDAKALMSFIEQVGTQAPDYSKLLVELSLMLHKIAMLQVMPDYPVISELERDVLAKLAESVTSEDIQLYYQISIQAKADLDIAPDAKSGFQMILLRMLAFKPQGVIQIDVAPELVPKKRAPQIEKRAQSGESDASNGRSQLIESMQSKYDLNSSQEEGKSSQSSSGNDIPLSDLSIKEDSEAIASTETEQSIKSVASSTVLDQSSHEGAHDDIPPWEASPLVEQSSQDDNQMEMNHDRSRKVAQLHDAINEGPPKLENVSPIANVLDDNPALKAPITKLAQLKPDTFPRFALSLGLMGPTGNALRQMSLTSVVGSTLNLVIDEAQLPLFKQRQFEQLTSLFNSALDQPIVLDIVAGDPGSQTPAMLRAKLDKRRHMKALDNLKRDQHIDYMLNELNGTLREHTVVSLIPEEL